MDEFLKTFYPCIDEQLEKTYKKLWKTNTYQNLIEQQSIFYNNVYEKLDKDFQKEFENYVNATADLKEDEKYHIYLTGFINGILLSNHLKETS